MSTPANRRAGPARSLICSLAVFGGLFASGAEPMEVRPFAERSGPRGRTMFTELSPDQTGVRAENRYADPEMWGAKYHEFEVGAIGTGVAIGDYDGDGRPDIFVVSKTESCRLFRNLGNWRFEDTTERAGVADVGEAAAIWKQGASFADVNNDGWLDLYVCRFAAPNLLYINQGNGAFVEAAAAHGLAVVDASATSTFCDYDRDGWLDVYVQTNLLDVQRYPAGRPDYLFRNNRDGTFSDVTARAGIAGDSQGHSATWWDYNNDGWPDLYVANDFARLDSLYRNNRDGTFTDVLSETVPHVPYSAMGSDTGDINNDGLIDLLVADMAATNHEKDQRTMADVRSKTRDQPDDAKEVPQYLYNAVFLNTGTDRCQEAAFLTGLDATDWSWTLRFEDLDNDGWLDLYVSNGMYREIHNTDLITRMMSSESAPERIRIARASPVLSEPNLAFRNLGELRFAEVGQEWGLNRKGVSFGGAFGDLDGDGDLDLVQTNYQAPVAVFRNDSDSGHRVVVGLRGVRSNRFGVGARVEVQTDAGVQVRQLVLTRGYQSTGEPILHFGLGHETKIHQIKVEWPSGAVQTIANPPADHHLLISEPDAAVAPSKPEVRAAQFTDVSAAMGLGVLAAEPVVDELASQKLLPMRHNRNGPALAVSDLDGDGFDDIAMGGTTKQPGRLFFSHSGRFSLETWPARDEVPLNDGPILVFEADGDGKPDVLRTRGGSALPVGSPEYQPELLLNQGGGRFQSLPADSLPLLPISVGVAIAADFDRDGDMDVFFGARVAPGEYPLPPSSALLANEGGKFDDVTARVAPQLTELGMVASALWTDVDVDGWPDLLLALEWGTIRCLRNLQGQGFEDWTETAGFAAAGTGWWSSLAAADFNGDGRMDYVAGNAGWNTRYRPTTEKPIVLLYGDFADGAGPQLIEGYYEGANLYPRRSRRELSTVLPDIRRRFPRNDLYARATLQEIIPADRLANAIRLEVTNLASGVFLSQSNGTYQWREFPRIAQLGPAAGIAAGDFDGDGCADVYLLQNSYSLYPPNGRCDGGISQLLSGDGSGGFTAVSPEKSGLVVPGNAKALVVTDLDADGWPDFVASRNNESNLAFRNSGFPGRHSFQLGLRGPAGNPTAIGARVTLVLADGTKRHAEITAGGGHWSQSAGTLFFGCPEENQPVRVEVRWPSGAESTHEIKSLTPRLVLTVPPGR